MVWSKIMSEVNNRIKAIINNSLDFGGVSIICVWDFHQLRPVKYSYVFQVSNIVLIIMTALLVRIFGRNSHLWNNETKR